MSMDDVRKNLGNALSIFAKALETSVNTMPEKNKALQLEYVDESGISHGYFRIFFCTPVNVLLHHNACWPGKLSIYSPESFVFNGTIQSIHVNYCYPRMYPDDKIYLISCTKNDNAKMNTVMIILIVSN